MAYEVARVHGLILSHIQDGGKEVSTPTWPLAQNKYQLQPRSSPDSPFLYDFPSDLNHWSESSHNSSLESSTETESEEDDDELLAGLAEKIAHSMLDDDETATPTGLLIGNPLPESSLLSPLNAGSLKATPPQPIWSPKSFSPCSSDSVSSSKQSSQVSSPPSTPSTLESAWDLLNAAAGEVDRLNSSEERKFVPSKQSSFSPVAGAELAKHCVKGTQQPAPWRQQGDILPLANSLSYDTSARTFPHTTGAKDRANGGGQTHSRSSRARDDDRKLINGQAQQRPSKYDGTGWNNRPIRQGNPQKGLSTPKNNRNHPAGQPRTSGKPIDRHPGAQRSGQGVSGGSGMRAVFLGSAGSGRESGGTGVFLPRCIGGGPDHRRKPACSTVLLPSRIVQVLNLNVEDMRSHPAALSAPPGHVRADYSSALRNSPHMYMMDLTAGTMKCEGGDLAAFPRKFHSPQVRQNVNVRRSDSIEYSLPTEWIY